MTEVFNRDLESTKRSTFELWGYRSWTEKVAERVLLPIKSQL